MVSTQPFPEGIFLPLQARALLRRLTPSQDAAVAVSQRHLASRVKGRQTQKLDLVLSGCSHHLGHMNRIGIQVLAALRPFPFRSEHPRLLRWIPTTMNLPPIEKILNQIAGHKSDRRGQEPTHCFLIDF